MTVRILPTLVAFVVCAFPAAAVAQTSDYPETPTTTTEQTPTPPPATDDSGTAPGTAEGSTPAAPAPAASPSAVATGTAPSTLAYTGSEVWLLGLVGLFAVAGGTLLLRSSRRRA